MAPENARLMTLIEARIGLRMPAPYLLEAAYMHGVRFHIDRRALIPRSFIGDLLAGGALPTARPRRILDLCCGSGCLAILAALAFPRAKVDAVDLSAGALALAAGEDGLDLVHRILAEAPRHLTKSGGLVCEIGRGRPPLEAAYPRLSFIWLDTELSEGEVFWLARSELA